MSRRVLILSWLWVALVSSLAYAADPPGRVARLNYMSGQVSIQPNGANDWVQGSVNRPLTSSDRVWTDKDSRAELQMGAASARLNSETSLTLANVSDRAVQLQLDQGTLNLHVIRLFDGEVYEIDTPNLAFTVEKPGDYRFDVDNAGDTTVVTVWKGRGEATGDNPGVRVGSKQQFTFSGGRSLRSVVTNAPGFDGFDSWCQVRAEREDRSPSLQYVSPYAVGYSDLDQYGRWETVAPYGPVWIPAGVAPGWAPYRWGHWVYIVPWGWTWVDDAPWGFAPFHYGRWVYFNNYWGWCPGPAYARPIYAPALVGWIGGPRWGFGLSFGIGGGVGWFPLGWGEPFVPWYGGSRGYFQNVNVSNTHITNITNVTNNYYGGHPVNPPLHYVNQHPYAVSAVSNETFTGSRPTRGTLVPVSAETLHGASVVNTVPVRPTRESMTGPAQHMAAPPSAAFNRPVMTKMTPPVPASASASEPTRPGRPVAAAPGNSAVANETVSRPPRAVPRPPSAGVPATGTAEASTRPVAHPPDAAVSRSVTQSSTLSRVPRPPSGVTPAVNSEHVTNPSSESERPTTASREYPHPTSTPSPVPSQASTANVNREARPQTHATETHTAPPAAVTHASPAPAPHATQPAHESHQENKSEKKETPHSDLRYPSPYNGNGAVREASYTRAVPRPTGPVAAAPRTYSEPSSGSARGYGGGSSYHSPAPAMRAPSYGSTPRSTASAVHGSHAAAHSAGHASARR